MSDYEETVASLRGVLERNGFVRCDVPACNCGSWHARYGYPERFRELSDALKDAGVLNNDTGNIASRALAKLIEQRDAQAAEVEALREDAEKFRALKAKVGHLYDFDAMGSTAPFTGSAARPPSGPAWEEMATTTPDDGERILGYWPDDPIIETVEWIDRFYREVGDLPTHWMKLPEPPHG